MKWVFFVKCCYSLCRQHEKILWQNWKPWSTAEAHRLLYQCFYCHMETIRPSRCYFIFCSKHSTFDSLQFSSKFFKIHNDGAQCTFMSNPSYSHKSEIVTEIRLKSQPNKPRKHCLLEPCYWLCTSAADISNIFVLFFMSLWQINVI